MAGKLTVVVHVFDVVGEFTGKIGYVLIPLTLVVFAEVVARYGFNMCLHWAYETGLNLYAGLGLLGGVYALRHRLHIRMDIFYNRLSLRGRAVVDVIMALVFFFYITVLLWQTAVFAIMSVQANEHTMSVWGPPMYPIKIVLVIAVFLVLLQGFAQFICDLYYVWTGRELT